MNKEKVIKCLLNKLMKMIRRETQKYKKKDKIGKNKYTRHGGRNLEDSNPNDCMLKMKLNLK